MQRLAASAQRLVSNPKQVPTGCPRALAEQQQHTSRLLYRSRAVGARRVYHHRRLGSRFPNSGDMSDDGDDGDDVVMMGTEGDGEATGAGLKDTSVADMSLPEYKQCKEDTAFKVAGLTLESEGVMRSCDGSGRVQLVPVFTWKQVCDQTEAVAEEKQAVRALFTRPPGARTRTGAHKRIHTLLVARGVAARDKDNDPLMLSCLGLQYALSDRVVVKALGAAGRAALEKEAKAAGSSAARATGSWEQRLQEFFDECGTPAERAERGQKVCLEGCSVAEKDEIISRLRQQARGPTGGAPPALGDDATRA